MRACGSEILCSYWLQYGAKLNYKSSHKVHYGNSEGASVYFDPRANIMPGLKDAIYYVGRADRKKRRRSASVIREETPREVGASAV